MNGVDALDLASRVATRLLVGLVAVVMLFGVSARAQSLADICAGATPSASEYNADRRAYADDFCALATHDVDRARSAAECV